MFSKLIHAGSAPVLIVGTHANDLGRNEILEINNVLFEEVLSSNRFNECRNGDLSYFPVDNVSGVGIEDLRTTIEKVVVSEDYIKDEVPVSFLRALEHMLAL